MTTETTDTDVYTPRSIEHVPDIEWSPKSIDLMRVYNDDDDWIESPQHHDVHYKVMQGINPALDDELAHLANHLDWCWHEFFVIYNTDAESELEFFVDHDALAIYIEVSTLLCVGDMSQRFDELADWITGMLIEDEKYTGPMPEKQRSNDPFRGTF